MEHLSCLVSVLTIGGERIALATLALMVYVMCMNLLTFATGEHTSSPRARKQFQARTSTAQDLPGHLWESILKRLPLVKYYQHGCCLGTTFLNTSPLPRYWLFKGIKQQPPIRKSTLDLDGQPNCSFSLIFAEPKSGKEEEIRVHLKGSELDNHVTNPANLGPASITVVPGNGLLFLSIGPKDWSHVQSSFYILNPVNGSQCILPSVPYTVGSLTRWTPLKLEVASQQNVGLKCKCGESSSYKCYLMGEEYDSNQSNLTVSISYRIIVYDSTLSSWALTGIQRKWLDKFPIRALDAYRRALIDYHYRPHFSPPQVFSTEGESLYMTRGSSECYCLRKFHNCAEVRTISAPHNMRDEDMHCGHCARAYCGCISRGIFQSEGKIFFFKQTSWKGPFGPNCISITLSELDMKAMVWQKPITLPTHRLEVCQPPYSEKEMIKWFGLHSRGLPTIFKYEGMLLVVYSDLSHIAAVDISKKAWCKVPETLLETAVWFSKAAYFEGGNPNDVDRLVFQPNCHARARSSDCYHDWQVWHPPCALGEVLFGRFLGWRRILSFVEVPKKFHQYVSQTALGIAATTDISFMRWVRFSLGDIPTVVFSAALKYLRSLMNIFSTLSSSPSCLYTYCSCCWNDAFRYRHSNSLASASCISRRKAASRQQRRRGRM